MSSSNTDIFGIDTTQVTVGPGATLAQFIDITARQTNIVVKYFSGSTLILQPALNGSTMAGASLVAGYSVGYILGVNEAVTMDGPVRFYLSAQGATGVAMILKGLTNPGFNTLGS
jgi:hypothetical protein